MIYPYISPPLECLFKASEKASSLPYMGGLVSRITMVFLGSIAAIVATVDKMLSTGSLLSKYLLSKLPFVRGENITGEEIPRELFKIIAYLADIIVLPIFGLVSPKFVISLHENSDIFKKEPRTAETTPISSNSNPSQNLHVFTSEVIPPSSTNNERLSLKIIPPPPPPPPPPPVNSVKKVSVIKKTDHLNINKTGNRKSTIRKNNQVKLNRKVSNLLMTLILDQVKKIRPKVKELQSTSSSSSSSSEEDSVKGASSIKN